jgi:hypothetical protein
MLFISRILKVTGFGPEATVSGLEVTPLQLRTMARRRAAAGAAFFPQGMRKKQGINTVAGRNGNQTDVSARLLP